VGAALILPLRPESAPPENVTVIEASLDGWWYSLTLPTLQTLLVFLTDRDLLPRGKAAIYGFLHQELQATAYTLGRFDSNTITGNTWRFFDARSSFRRTVLADGWIAVGDAVMAVDPLAGNGVVRSINNALEVCDWLAKANGAQTEAVPEWATRICTSIASYEHERRSKYSAERRWPESRFWMRRSVLRKGNGR
jgi:2-polyprenyl-6-methoxyphenol hydroxylase-like FAD-dependent oxidoreductase